MKHLSLTTGLVLIQGVTALSALLCTICFALFTDNVFEMFTVLTIGATVFALIVDTNWAKAQKNHVKELKHEFNDNYEQ